MNPLWLKIFLIANYLVLSMPGLFLRELRRQKNPGEKLNFKALAAMGVMSALGGVAMLQFVFEFGIVAPLLPWPAFKEFWIQILGTAVTLSSLTLCLWSQKTMGSSWRLPMVEGQNIELVTIGPYRFMRHPIYNSIIVMNFGLFLCVPSVLTLCVFFASLYFFTDFMRIEEQQMHKRFGTKYQDYTQKVGRWPRLGL
jgi:protein-S-isoprenylcysteine O-methyltransferase Ste14